MGRKKKSQKKHLNIWMNGEIVGCWTVEKGQNTFNYLPDWLSNPRRRPISISIPLAPSNYLYKETVVENYFDNLLPDSTEIRERIQVRFGTGDISSFELLGEIGRDCAGAIQLLPDGEEPLDIKTIKKKPLTDKEIETTIKMTTANRVLGQIEEDDFRFSLAGAQEKTTLLKYDNQWHKPIGTTPSTHILKLPMGKLSSQNLDLSTSVENEWLCSEILKEYGIPTASTQITQFEDQKVLVVERFDRQLSADNNWIIRKPVEDLCQATGTSRFKKYQSDGGPGVKELMKLFLGSQKAMEDRKMFFTTQLLFWMLAAIDGHAKNFSIFIHKSGQYSLTPLYDVLSAYPILGKGAGKLSEHKIKMAMAVYGKKAHYKWKNISRRHWLETARITGITEFSECIDELIAKTPKVISKIFNKLPEGFPASVSEDTLMGLKAAANRLKE